MIRFEGTIARECKKFIRAGEVKVTLICGMFAIAVLAYPCFAWISKLMDSMFFAVTMYITLIAAFVLMAFMGPTKKDIDSLSPVKICISPEEGYIEATCQRFVIDRDLSEIKAVVDHGDWYSFKFSGRGAPSHRFICQKNLIVEGTIEDFEKLFEKKMIRKAP